MKDLTYKELDYSMRFKFPNDCIDRLLEDGRTLIITPSIPNWITLISPEEKRVFQCLFNGMSIEETIKELGDSYTEVLKNVLIELLHSNFCDSDEEVSYSGSKCNLTAYLTNNCNLKCHHCYRFNSIPGTEMSTEQWKHILTDYSSLDDCGGYVTFTGGEVSVKADSISLFKHSSECGLRNVCLTNGTLWNVEDYEQILPYLYEIQISLDGINAEMNDAVRGEGTYEKIISSLDSIAHVTKRNNLNLRIAIAMTFMPEDLDRVKASILPFVKQLKHKMGQDIIFRVASRLKEGRYVSELDDDANKRYKALSAEIKSLIYDDPFWEARLYSTSFSPFLKVVNCGFGQNISIQPNGIVQACSESHKEIVGDAATDSIVVIRERLKDIFNKTSLDNMEECAVCDVRYMCGGGCRIDNLLYKESYIKPSPCQMNPMFKNSIYQAMADRRQWSWTK